MGRRFDPQLHSKTMRAVRSRNTKHEVLLRDYLAEAGYMDESEKAGLPFNPDVALYGPKVAIFMHGCFWHRHKGCRFAYEVSPASPNYASWQSKFLANRASRIRVYIGGNWEITVRLPRGHDRRRRIGVSCGPTASMSIAAPSATTTGWVVPSVAHDCSL